MPHYVVVGADRNTGNSRGGLFEARDEDGARARASDAGILVASIHQAAAAPAAMLASGRGFPGWWSRMTSSACGIFVGLTVFLGIGWVVVVVFWASMIAMLRASVQSPAVAPVVATTQAAAPSPAAMPAALEVRSDWNKWSDETNVSTDLGTVIVAANGPPLTLNVSTAYEGQTPPRNPSSLFLYFTAYSDFNARFWFDEESPIVLSVDGHEATYDTHWFRAVDEVRGQTTEAGGFRIQGRDDVQAFLSARAVTGRIGPHAFTLSDAQFTALRDLNSRLTPP